MSPIGWMGRELFVALTVDRRLMYATDPDAPPANVLEWPFQ